MQVIFLRCYQNSRGRKTQNLKSEIIHILQSHYPPSGNVQVILLKFKIATTSQLFKYLLPQKTLTLFMARDDLGLLASCFFQSYR